MNNRHFLIIGAIALIVAVGAYLFATSDKSGSETASAAGEFVEGVHFRTVAGIESGSASKIQVQEFFWYGCPHCEAFEPAIRQYEKTLPGDVELVQIPVTWNEATRLHAAMFFLAESKLAPEEFHTELFKSIIALRKEGNLEAHVQEAEKVFSSHGIEVSDFKKQLQSPDIQTKLDTTNELMRALEISGTPSVVVDNTWVVLNTDEVAQAGVFNVVDSLIEKARSTRK